MITGQVNARLEAFVRVAVQDTLAVAHEFEAVIDSGYNGFLALPTALIAQLGLTFLGREPVELGDGSTEIFDLYAATVIWGEHERAIAVDAAETEPLIGMALLDGYDVSMRVASGGPGIITPIPPADLPAK